MKTKYAFFLIFLFWLLLTTHVEAADRKEGIENFPQSYQPYLQELKKKYPNWKFVALNTNLNWKDVVDQENEFGKNLVPKSYQNSWKNTKIGEYNIEVDKGWVDCSRKAIEYTMDPRNFLNEVRVFQFEGLTYDANTTNQTAVEKILYGTEFYNRTVQYFNSAGTTITTNQKYSDLILKAGKTANVSSYHLASRIKQEVGPFLSHSSISGTVKGYEGFYNFYNIGATSSSEPMGAIKNGLQYAKDGKGATAAIKTKYLIPWNTKEKAITGGAIFIGSSYISIGQDTVYLQKFHVSGQSGSSLFWHQYMTNVLAPYSESKSIYDGYANSGILNGTMTFVIPIYYNMPSIPVQSPNILETDFINDDTKVYANVTGGLNIRTGPSTSYEVLTTVSPKEKMTRLGKGKQTGELWDRVKLSNGMIGYAFQNYLKPVEVIPQNITTTQFPTSWNVKNNQISGLNWKELTVAQMKQKIKTNGTIKIYHFTGKELTDAQFVGTGSTVKIFDTSGTIKEQYQLILYGDVNGDGKINSTDLLVLQRHILQIEPLKGVFYTAGNVQKNGRSPSSIDSLFIQRHILGLQYLTQ